MKQYELRLKTVRAVQILKVEDYKKIEPKKEDTDTDTYVYTGLPDNFVGFIAIDNQHGRGRFIVCAGDWIVEDAFGAIRKMTDDDFRELYQPIDND